MFVFVFLVGCMKLSYFLDTVYRHLKMHVRTRCVDKSTLLSSRSFVISPSIKIQTSVFERAFKKKSCESSPAGIVKIQKKNKKKFELKFACWLEKKRQLIVLIEKSDRYLPNLFLYTTSRPLARSEQTQSARNAQWLTHRSFMETDGCLVKVKTRPDFCTLITHHASAVFTFISFLFR